jgi:8-oxo-dGTP pyrophosphatase MutT (NUDIX family)
VSVGFPQVQEALSARPARALPEAVSSRAAVAVILREGERDGERTGPGGLEMLFIRRAEHEGDPWSGQIGFPGGRQEPGDRDLAATAERETEEEIGIDLRASAVPLGALDEIRATARGRLVDLAIAPFVYRLTDAAAAIRLSPEVTDVHWIPLEDLTSDAHQGTFQYRHADGSVDLPCLRVGEVVIWGLTYRMFSGLRERLDQTIVTPGGGFSSATVS